MTAQIVSLTKHRRQAKRKPQQRRVTAAETPRPPRPLLSVSEQAVRMMQLAKKDLADKNWKSAALFIDMAARDLDRSIKAYVEGAQRDVRLIVLDALGPDVTVGEIQGARKALSLVLDCLPSFTDRTG